MTYRGQMTHSNMSTLLTLLAFSMQDQHHEPAAQKLCVSPSKSRPSPSRGERGCMTGSPSSGAWRRTLLQLRRLKAVSWAASGTSSCKQKEDLAYEEWEG